VGKISLNFGAIRSGFVSRYRNITDTFLHRIDFRSHLFAGSTAESTNRLLVLFIGLVVVFASAAIVWSGTKSAPPNPAAQSADALPPLADKPIYNWRVCQDLGVGPVPGLPEPHQRLRLCHNKGWEVLAYCLRPDLPVPELGTICTRISKDSYWCGKGMQPLKEYKLVQDPTDTPTPTATFTATSTPTFTPTPTSTPTYTPTPTSTNTPTSTSTATPTATFTPTSTATNTPVPPKPTRTPPGGRGYRDLSEYIADQQNANVLGVSGFTHPTPTQFQPLLPMLESSAQSVPPSEGNESTFYGIDFLDPGKEIQIKIYPPNRRINNGGPIVITFIPGEECSAEDKRGCIRKYSPNIAQDVTFVTAHSGVGGVGQAFRNAVEGTGFNQTAYSLDQVHKNLHKLEGSEVVIKQGKKTIEGFKLVAASRIPPDKMAAYLNRPIKGSLRFASRLDPSLNPFVDSGQPQVVFETCGWQMPEEPWLPGNSNTSASIYLAVIQKTP